MNFEQLLVCVGFGLIVYGIGFWRGLREGYGFSKRDEHGGEK